MINKMEELYLILTPREARILEHSRLAENRDFLEADDRACPRCRMGRLNEWTGVCSVCSYPEFNDDEPCYNCEDEDCEKCEYARRLREEIIRREERWRRIVSGKKAW